MTKVIKIRIYVISKLNEKLEFRSPKIVIVNLFLKMLKDIFIYTCLLNFLQRYIITHDIIICVPLREYKVQS